MTFRRRLPLLVLALCAALATKPLLAMAQPALAPLVVEVTKFETEPIDPFNAAEGADTCVVVATTESGAANMRWFYSSRLVARKKGQARVLWDYKDNSSREDWPDPEDPKNLMGEPATFIDAPSRTASFFFKLRDVPAEDGEISFEWDALAQAEEEPVALGETEFLAVADMDEAAKDGAVRLSRKLVLRRDGATIRRPDFADEPPLRILGVEVEPVLLKLAPDDNDTRVVLRLAYEGDEAEPKLTVPGGLRITDADEKLTGEEDEPGIPRSYTESAQREGQTKIYSITATIRKTDLKGVQFLYVEADVSDGKSWPLHIKEGFDLQHAPK